MATLQELFHGGDLYANFSTFFAVFGLFGFYKVCCICNYSRQTRDYARKTYEVLSGKKVKETK